MTFGIILPITTGAINTATNGNNPCYSENPAFPDGHRYSAIVYRSVAGTYNIFVQDSYDWGQTWTETQITFMTGTTRGHQYVGSCCPDLDGRGLHVFWYGYGYGNYNQTFVMSLLYAYRDSAGVWSGTQIVELGLNNSYSPSYPRFRAICHMLLPSAQIDSKGDVHLAYEHPGSYNPYFLPGSARECIYYRKLNVLTGVWGELASFHYNGNGATHCDLHRPNLQVDQYDNPHITCVILSPVNGWGYAHTTCWFMNPNKGDYTAWPGSTLPTNPRMYWYQFPVASQYAELLYDIPTASGTPSYYSRMALSPYYTEGTFDYPHCIYTEPAGVTHKYMDATGWHTVNITPATNCTYPSLAIGADGMIYALNMLGSGSAHWQYRKKALPADAWSAAEQINSISYPRQIHQQFPVHYPWDGQECSPFMASQSGWAKLFRCGFPATSGYGYFM